MAWLQLDNYVIQQKQENIKQWLGYNWISMVTKQENIKLWLGYNWISMVSTKNRKTLSNGLVTTGYLWYPRKTGKY